MKAIVYHEHGGTEVVRYEEVARPSLGSDEVMLTVGAVGINPGPDLDTRSGRFGVGSVALPHIGGVDPAGRVVQVGEAVDDVRPGDRVAVYPIIACGHCEACRSGLGENYCRAFRIFGVHLPGGRAELTSAPARQLVQLPDSVSFEAAAALGVAYTTTWHGLSDRGGIVPADTVLVVGAGGGCGVAAVQLARRVGARVLAVTGSSEKEQRLLELGADAVFDYRDAAWPQAVRRATGGMGVTLAFDNAGTATLRRTVECLARRGRLVCSGATTGTDVQLDLRLLYRDHIDLRFYVQGTRSNMQELVGMVARGELAPVVDEVFPLADAARADERAMSSERFGRVVLRGPAADPRVDEGAR